MAISYTRSDWTAGSPITEQKMSNIETGIENAINQVNTNSNTVQAHNTRIGALETSVSQTLPNAISDAQTNAVSEATASAKDYTDGQIRGIALEADKGNAAYEQMVEAGIFDPAASEPGVLVDNSEKSKLVNKLNEFKSYLMTAQEQQDNKISPEKTVASQLASLESTSTNAKAILQEVQTARGNSESLNDRLDLMQNYIKTINDAGTNYDNGLPGRLDWIENTLKEKAKEVTDAHSSTALQEEISGAMVVKTFQNLDERFEFDERLIKQQNEDLGDRIGALENVAIVDNLTSNSTANPLSANQGRVLKGLIDDEKAKFGNSIDSTNTVSVAINNAITTANTYADTNKVAKSKITDSLTWTRPAVASPLEDSVLSAVAGKALNDRLKTVEDEIGAANLDSTLSARFAAVESDVETIASELRMTDITDKVVQSTSRIDQLESNVVEMAKEIGMIQNGAEVQDMASAISGQGSRIDSLASEISHEASGNDKGGLKERMTAAESHATALDAEDVAIKGRVSTLESNDPSTVGAAVKYQDIVNNLTTTSREVGKALDARQGKVLADDLDAFMTKYNRVVGDEAKQDGLIGTVAGISTDVNVIKNSLGSYATSSGAIANAFNDINNTIGSGFNTTNTITKSVNDINAKIGGNYDSTNTVAADITAKATAAKNYTDAASTAINDKIGSGFDSTNTVAKAVNDINAKIGGNYDSTNTVAADIAAKASAAKDYTDEKITATTTAYTEADATNLQAAKDYTDEKISATKTAYETADAALGGRLNTVEGILNDAKASTVADTTYDSLDARLEAIESHAATADTTASDLRADVNKIAGELSMLDNDTITDVGTRIDNITDEINAAHRQLVDENEEPIADSLDKRFDDIEARADTLERQNLNTRVTTLESTVTNEETGLAATKAIADANKTAIGNNNSGLMGRVHTLETQPKSATTIIEKERIVYNKDGVPTVYTAAYNEQGINTPITPSNEVDYLFETEVGGEVKYFYWKYIDNKWELISGGGGSGNNSGYVGTIEEYNNLEEKNENTDYYILQEDGYHHYRWINNQEYEISEPNKYYNVAIETVSSADGDVNYLNLYEFNPGDNTIIDAETDLSKLESKRIRHIVLPATGGGSAVVNTMRITQVTSRNVYSAYNSKASVKIRFFFTTGEENERANYNFTVDGVTILQQPANISSGAPANKSYTWPVDEDDKELSPAAAGQLGFYEFDVTDYCKNLGTHNVKLTIALDSNSAITSESNWIVQTVNLGITSNFTNNPIVPVGSSVPFTYIPSGNIEKTVHFVLDGTEIGTTPLNARVVATQTYNIPAQNVAGAKKLSVYITANNGAIRTDPIYRDIIWQDTSSSQIILASPYRNNIEKLQQYENITIPYTVAGGTGTYLVKYYIDDFKNTVNEVNLVNSNSGSWTYRATDSGDHVLRIAAGESYIDIYLTVMPLTNKDLAPVTDNLAIDFNPQGITNSSTKRLWTNGTYHLTVSDNFDWSNGGYGSDTTGDYFLIKAGTRAYFDYKMFKGYAYAIDESTSQIRSTAFRDGAEMKIIFKTAAVRDASATWFTNMGKINENENAKEVGIQLNVHNGWLKTDSASNKEINGVAATNTYLYFPYSEEDKIELDININKEADEKTKGLFIMSYEDGCPSKAYPYSSTEALYHTANKESIITIGSDDCDVYLYKLRIYTTALDTDDVLRNFIADGKDIDESISRYDRNSIYWDVDLEEYTPYEGVNTTLDPERLAVKLPDVKILMLDAPWFTSNKKDFIPHSSLRCIHAPGGKVYPSRGKEDNWLFENGYHAGQGTTSDKYGNAGRNVDFLFECDGVHNPSDKVKDEKFIPNYQSSLILGYGTSDQAEPTYCLDWKDEDTWKPNTTYDLLYTMSNGDTHDMLVRYNGKVYKCLEAHTSGETFDESKWAEQEGYTSKISLQSSSIPNNFFNLKVNIASSENVNNALLQKRYNDWLTYKSPAYLRDNRIKNDMEFVPALLFLRENDDEHTTEIIDGKEVINYTNHTEFNDKNWHFYALGNLGDSKKTDYTRAYDPTDINEFTIEISDNNTNNSQFQSGVYYSSIYYDRVTNPVNEDINKYYEADGEVTLVQNESNRYTGTFVPTTDTEIVSTKTYYTRARMVEAYYTEQDKEDDGTPIKDSFTAKSNAGESLQSMSYVFPITQEEWSGLDENNQPKNMRYWSLFNEGLDGDHSFEMRYAYFGNYRDGKLVNGNKDESKAVQKRNSGVWRAFYSWLVTSPDEQFIAELDQWVVRRSVAFFYAYTHYYTMMDNRAKNTFWHFAKTGTHRRVLHPVKELLHTYDENPNEDAIEDSENAGVWNGTFVRTEDTSVNTEKQYYTEYAFDMWVYDTDTALGIDNNGELVFPYGKEDTDYRIDGDASSSYVFNGAGSIFWRRLSKSFNSDIVNAFTNADSRCFNAEHLIQEFDKVQECYPEAIWRLDVERKYIRSFTGNDGHTEENPNQKIFLTRKETRFLRDMMQGRKKYQRRQWCKDQDTYFGSKYLLTGVLTDFFEFSCYNPPNMAVTPNWDLTITPYQDMYINISYAETFARPFRAKAGVAYEFKSILNDMNDSRIRVYGANHIQSLAGKAQHNDPDDPEKITGADGLASFYMKANNFEHSHKLRQLILGTPNTAYENGNFTTLNISNNNPILEVLDIQNCNNLGGQLPLSESTALKRIEAQGTQITSVNLPANTSLEYLHLPETINNLTLYAAKNLKEITIKTRDGVTDYSNLATLSISDSDYAINDENELLINWMSIATAALNHISNLQLINLRLATINDINELDAFVAKKEQLGNYTNSAGEVISYINLTGIINVLGSWSQVQKDNYAGTPDSTWPNLTLNTTGKEEYKRRVNYHYNNKVYSIYVTTNTTAPDPYADHNIELPTKDVDNMNRYAFGNVNESNAYVAYSGWCYANSNTPLNSAPLVQASEVDLDLYAWFRAIPRYYTIRWFLDSKKTQKVGEVSGIPYGGGINVIAPTVKNIHSGDYNSAQKISYIPYETCEVTVADTGLVHYKVFNGWNKPHINITPDGSTDYYDIFAVWDEEDTTINAIFNDVTPNKLTEKQLLVLSAMSENLKQSATFADIIAPYSVGYQTAITLGHDSDKTGTVIVSDTSTSVNLANGPITTNIQPFKDEAFTFVIDYTCASNDAYSSITKPYASIVSCYHSANGVKHGFGILKNISTGNIEVGFGDFYNNSSLRQAISDDEYNNSLRNIVVIRHPKRVSANSNDILEIYSSSSNTTSLPTDGPKVYTFASSINDTSTFNAYLNIGQLFDSSRESVQSGDQANKNSIVNGLARVHWAKYWNQDLGADECTKLASWPHEQLTFSIASLYKDPNVATSSRATTTDPVPSLYLASMNLPTHGLWYQSRIQATANGQVVSWGDSDLRKLYQNHLFQALPYTMQAILYKRSANTQDLYYNVGEQGANAGFVLNTLPTPTLDYLTPYSMANIIPKPTGSTTTNSPYDQEAAREDLKPFSWYNSISNVIQIFNYQNNAWTAINSEGYSNPNYLLTIRFPYKPIKWGVIDQMHIYDFGDNSLAVLNVSFANSIGPTALRSGDIIKYKNAFYIYVSNYEINKYGLYTENTNEFAGLPDNQVDSIRTYSDNQGAGGWIKSESYWNRSLVVHNTRTTFTSTSVLGMPDSSTNSETFRQLSILMAI